MSEGYVKAVKTRDVSLKGFGFRFDFLVKAVFRIEFALESETVEIFGYIFAGNRRYLIETFYHASVKFVGFLFIDLVQQRVKCTVYNVHAMSSVLLFNI